MNQRELRKINILCNWIKATIKGTHQPEQRMVHNPVVLRYRI